MAAVGGAGPTVTVDIQGTIANLKSALDQAKNLIENFAPRPKMPRTGKLEPEALMTQKFTASEDYAEYGKRLEEIASKYKAARKVARSWQSDQQYEKQILGELTKMRGTEEQQLAGKYVPGVNLASQALKNLGVESLFLGKTGAAVQKNIQAQLDPLSRARELTKEWTTQSSDALTVMEKFGMSEENIAGSTRGLADAFVKRQLPALRKLNPAMAQLWQDSLSAKASFELLQGDTEGLNERLGDYYKRQEGAAESTEEGTRKQRGFLSSTTRAGQKLAWFGFRLTMVGRIFQRALSGTITDIVRQFTAWDKTISSIGISLGFLASRGLITSDTFATMIETMYQLPETGQMMESIFGLWSTLLSQIGNNVIPIIGPAIITLIEKLMELWETNKGLIIPIFEKLATETIPKLIDTLDKYGGPALEGFFKGLDAGIISLTGLLDALGPILPTLTYFFGLLVAYSPVIIALGLALYFLSIPLQILSPLVSGLAWIFNALLLPALGVTTTQGTALAGTIANLQVAWAALTPFLLPIIIILGAIWTWWNEITTTIGNFLMPALGRLFGALGSLTGGLDLFATAWNILKYVTAPIAMLIMVIVGAFSGLIDIITGVINMIKGFIDLVVSNPIVKGILEWFGGISKGYIDMMDTINKVLSTGKGGSWGNTVTVTKDVTGLEDTNTKTIEKAVKTTNPPTITNMDDLMKGFNSGTFKFDTSAFSTQITPPLDNISKYTLDMNSTMKTMNVDINAGLETLRTDLKDSIDKLAPSLVSMTESIVSQNNISTQGFSDIVSQLAALQQKETFKFDTSAFTTQVAPPLSDISKNTLDMSTIIKTMNEDTKTGFGTISTDLNTSIDKIAPILVSTNEGVAKLGAISTQGFSAIETLLKQKENINPEDSTKEISPILTSINNSIIKQNTINSEGFTSLQSTLQQKDSQINVNFDDDIKTGLNEISKYTLPLDADIKAGFDNFKILGGGIETLRVDLKGSLDNLAPPLVSINESVITQNAISTQGFTDIVSQLATLQQKEIPQAPITVDVDIVIENVSSNVDIGYLTDEVSRKITDAIQRVRI